jgi:hypothetical protein
VLIHPRLQEHIDIATTTKLLHYYSPSTLQHGRQRLPIGSNLTLGFRQLPGPHQLTSVLPPIVSDRQRQLANCSSLNHLHPAGLCNQKLCSSDLNIWFVVWSGRCILSDIESLFGLNVATLPRWPGKPRLVCVALCETSHGNKRNRKLCYNYHQLTSHLGFNTSTWRLPLTAWAHFHGPEEFSACCPRPQY